MNLAYVYEWLKYFFLVDGGFMRVGYKSNNASGLEKFPGFKQKRLSNALLWQLIISVWGFPLSATIANAQTTTCSGASSNSCVDLYQGTLAAMQAVGYQPSGASSASGATTSGVPIPAPWTITSFQGGVISSSPMVFTVPADTGVPGNTTLASTFVYACPGGKSNNGTVSISASVSDTTEITSGQTVTNTSSTFNNDSMTVSIGYTPPKETGGPTGNVSNTYAWGTTTTESTATSSSTSNTSVPLVPIPMMLTTALSLVTVSTS